MVCSLFEQFENKCKNKYNLQIKLWEIQMRKTDFASYSLTQWQFWQLTLKWLSGALAQDKNKQYYYCFLFFLFLFNYVIQEKFTAWRVNSTLNFPWKTDITIIASRFVSKYIYIDIYRWEKLLEINQTIELLKWVLNEIDKANFSKWDCILYIYLCCDRGKNRETILSSLQACFVIAHSAGDFIVKNIRTIVYVYINILCTTRWAFLQSSFIASWSVLIYILHSFLSFGQICPCTSTCWLRSGKQTLAPLWFKHTTARL